MTNLLLILACLSQFESGDDDKKVGSAFERGRYQIHEVAWMEITRQPFVLAHRQDAATVIASAIIVRRSQEFKRYNHRLPTPAEIFVLWNAPAQIGKPSKKVLERARRFENLYREMERKQKK